MRKVLIAAAALLLLVLLLLATFPLSWLKGTIADRIAARTGESARIGVLERESIFSFSPIVRVGHVHVDQPRWAGRGEMASVRLLRLRVAILPLLVGRFEPELIAAEGVRLDLVRAADGRANWRTGKSGESGGGGGDFGAVSARDVTIRYRDAVQKRAFTLAVTIGANGLTANGTGVVDGAPVRIAVRGPAMVKGREWPFTAAIDGAALTLHARGTMAGPLRTDAMTMRIATRADDLKRLDRVIEAGLFGTQPIDLTADVRHEDDSWIVERLTGAIGQSKLTGHVTARRVDGRTKLDGNAHFATLDFDDLGDDAGNAEAQALEQREGLRLVPNTRVNLAKLDDTDGRIAIRADRITSRRRPSSLKSISGVLTLDRQRLTIDHFRIGLGQGEIIGNAIVDQRGGKPEPLVTLALDLRNSSIAALAGGEVDGRVDGRVRLKGVGSTIREAVGRSDGRIGLVARSGSMPTKIAAMIGFDIGRGLLFGGDDPVTLRCAVIHLNMRNGSGTLSPFLVDTSISQTHGTGKVSFPSEAVAATLTGAPKGGGGLYIPGSVIARGSIREPEIVVPRETKSLGNIFKAIGRAISGDRPQAPDVDCDTLSRRALAG